jgi:protein-tyrosine phosphatase
MDEIRPWLYIGKYRDTLNKNHLDFNSITAMLQLADRVEQKGINSLFIPVEDMGPTSHVLIKQGVDFILEEKGKKHRILVACGAGINRSTAFCMAALRETEGLSLLDAFKEIKRRHPESMPHEPVWESFCKYYNESTPYLDIMRLSIQNL